MLVNENLLAFDKYHQENVKKNRIAKKSRITRLHQQQKQARDQYIELETRYNLNNSKDNIREVCSHISCRYCQKDIYLQPFMTQCGSVQYVQYNFMSTSRHYFVQLQQQTTQPQLKELRHEEISEVYARK